MPLQDQTEYAGRRFQVTWESRHILPPRHQITQVSAVCFTADDKILMISKDGTRWNIPGGHPEDGESLEDALRREVWEEACCKIAKPTLLGWQRVQDLQDGSIHYQMRYCCQAQIMPFNPQHEVNYRKFVNSDNFLKTLEYGYSSIAKALLKLSLAANIASDKLYSGDPDQSQ